MGVTRALLLAGGAGTRLWPLSTEETPKQFLPLLSEKSLLAETYERVLPLTEEIFVATTENHADLVFSELKSLPADRIVLEPARRNSGPALLSAALQFERDGDPMTAAIPSDQTVADADAFRASLSAAAEGADTASVVVLGVPPSRPETDYGYLEVAESASGEGLEVIRFIEKPGPARTRKPACAPAASGTPASSSSARRDSSPRRGGRREASSSRWRSTAAACASATTRARGAPTPRCPPSPSTTP